MTLPGRRLRAGRTRGLTLVELLVVVFILGVLLGLGVFFYPSYSSKAKMVRATDQITGMFIRAKQQAKRDGLPTGVRLLVPGGNCAELQLIQQPDVVALGRITSVASTTVTFDTNITGLGLVEVGDYLEINGGGKLYQITAIGTSSATVDSAPPAATYPGNTNRALSNYRVFPQPRPLAGESTVALPPTTQITIAKSILNPRSGLYDILFSPGGNVINQSVGGGQNLLVVEDLDGDTGGAPLVVGVQLRSGLVGVYPYTPGFTLVTPDRNSGM